MPLAENRPIGNSPPMGRIPLRGERPSSGSTRPFELSPGVFIMRKAVAAIRRRNTLSAVPLAIQKSAGQANNPTCRRLQCFFVLTKGMSAVGPRPTADIPLPMFARHPHRCSARLGVSGRARMSLVSVQSSNLPERPVVEETAAFLGVVPLCL